jgi:hypothetical protein
MSIVALQYKSELLVEGWLGCITQSEFSEYCNKKMSDPLSMSTKNQLILLCFGSLDRSVTSRTVVEIFSERHLLKGIYSKHHIAVVYGRGFQRIGFLIRLLDAISIHIVVFNHVETACKWLGVSGSEVDQLVQKIRKENQSSFISKTR